MRSTKAVKTKLHQAKSTTKKEYTKPQKTDSIISVDHGSGNNEPQKHKTLLGLIHL